MVHENHCISSKIQIQASTAELIAHCKPFQDFGLDKAAEAIEGMAISQQLAANLKYQMMINVFRRAAMGRRAQSTHTSNCHDH